MTPGEVAWLLLALLGFVGSAIYSGMETGLYTLNRVRLHILAHEGHRAALVLRRHLQHPTAMLTTLLIGNNIANYMGTAGVSVLLEKAGYNDWQTIGLNALLVTPLLFVFCEVLPKDLFAAHTDRLTYRMANLLDASRKVFRFTGLLPLISAFSDRLVRRLRDESRIAALHPRRQVTTLVLEGAGRGLLSEEQTSMVERVMALAGRTVRDEMVSWERVNWVSLSDPPQRLWELSDRSGQSRFPVLDSRGHVAGVVNVIDALHHDRAGCPPIEMLMRPVLLLPPSLSLRTALNRVQATGEPMAVIVEGDRPRGIVTVKDLVEPITGELANW